MSVTSCMTFNMGFNKSFETQLVVLVEDLARSASVGMQTDTALAEDTALNLTVEGADDSSVLQEDLNRYLCGRPTVTWSSIVRNALLGLTRKFVMTSPANI